MLAERSLRNSERERRISLMCCDGKNNQDDQSIHPVLGLLACLLAVSRVAPLSSNRAVTVAAASTKLTITRPDDWHLHLRDGPGMHSVVPHTAAHFGRAVIMPNLQPPVTTTQMVCIPICTRMHVGLFVFHTRDTLQDALSACSTCGCTSTHVLMMDGCVLHVPWCCVHFMSVQL